MSAALLVAGLCVALGACVRNGPRSPNGRVELQVGAGGGVGRIGQRGKTAPSSFHGATVGAGVVSVLAAVAVGGSVGLAALAVIVAAVAGVRWLSVRRVGRRALAARAAALPDLIDLCRVAASAGASVWAVLEVVAPRAPEPCRPALRDLLARRDRGEPLAAGLRGLADALGPTASALTDALARSAATGSDLAPLLAEVAAAAHDQRRRQAQEDARRLPVTLLFPLALCVLPAAVVLAVVPVLVVSLHALSS